jgi:alanine-synthesizing transaminase
MEEFERIKRLPPYVFSIINEMKHKARIMGEDIVDLGMGNPDLPTPEIVVNKLVEAVKNPKNHRYSASKGIYKLRLAFANWYKRRFNVELDPETEIVVTIGSKEGFSHLMLAIVGQGDAVLVPTPTYPIHRYAPIIAGGYVRGIPLLQGDFFENIVSAYNEILPPPRVLVISFPHNPTTMTVELDFFRKIVFFAKEKGIIVIHDFAYADLVFDGYIAPSFLQVEGAKDVGVEFFTMSKSYNMPGWRVGFAAGNSNIISALAKLKSYLDYGMFQPIQIASIMALNELDEWVKKNAEIYRIRRDVLCDGLKNIGWDVEKPKGSMFVWAKIPEPFISMGSLNFSKFLLEKAKVAVSPGIGFGEGGEGYVRFALVENEHRIKQAIRGIRRALYGGVQRWHGQAL